MRAGRLENLGSFNSPLEAAIARAAVTGAADGAGDAQQPALLGEGAAAATAAAGTMVGGAGASGAPA
eukprot:2223126-Prymnesium_polylepis.1